MVCYDTSSHNIFSKYKGKTYLDKKVKSLVTDNFIQKTLAYKNVDVYGIKYEWTSLKTISSRWDKNEIPPQNLAEIGKRVRGHDNLFALMDYFLTQNISSAEAERGFSVLKETKTVKRANFRKLLPLESDVSHVIW